MLLVLLELLLDFEMFFCRLHLQLRGIGNPRNNVLIGFDLYSGNVRAQILTQFLKRLDMILLLIDLPCGVFSYLPCYLGLRLCFFGLTYKLDELLA